MSLQTIKRALISLSDKTNIVPFAQQLHALKIEILSTGGTAKLLREHHIPVIEVAEFTGFPEMLDGRVKTLHPKIHAGLLARRGADDEIMAAHDLHNIDLLVVNLYPFEATISNPTCDLATAIENIDIGGPTMLRAAAKNYQYVTVIIDPADYTVVLKQLETHQNATDTTMRFALAQKVFAHTAHYDAIISDYLQRQTKTSQNLYPENFTAKFHKKQDLRYGENPHQTAAFYADSNPTVACIATAEQLHGKELSFNNIADTDAAFECVKTFLPQSACVIVKHANPCGVGVSDNQLHAYEKAFATDPTSAFGGILAFNQPLHAETAEKIIANQFVEVIIAPQISPEALALLQKKPAIRVLSCHTHSLSAQDNGLDYKRVVGGMLIQQRDNAIIAPADLKVVTQRQPTTTELEDLIFAWKVAKFVKSNAIVFAKNLTTIGIGAGQMSRIDSVQIACSKAAHAKLSTQNCVMASDAFFPFRDGVDAAVAAGIIAIIQPGGSIRDEEVIAAANSANITMIFTGIRHFRH